MTTPYVLNQVRETSNVLGPTNTIQLFGPTSTMKAFLDFLIDQDTVLYKIDDFKGNWESGVGTYDGTLNSISRDTIISSSNFDLPVDFPEGTKAITSVLDAKIVQQLLELIPYPFW